MSAPLKPLITSAGLTALFNGQQNGLKAEITHIAFGDHGRTPSAGEKALKSEKARHQILTSQRLGPHTLNFTVLADGDREFWIREVGFYLADGTLFAVWSSTSPLAYKSASVDFELTYDLLLDALPADSVTIVSTSADPSVAHWLGNYAELTHASVNAMLRDIKQQDANRALDARQKEDDEEVHLRITGVVNSLHQEVSRQVRVNEQHLYILSANAEANISNMTRQTQMLFRVIDLEKEKV
ncbi:phage tail protein [Veronia pacifica]|uniref:Phage tail fibre protein N-terminal domain-containing protein n=1 Tax=Veronia pacifica TaxID=1080227 RepID=A0A1C3EBL5_9GAMM|nr:phage tail protein [Veronia pacifica]ODA30625.1 hypothetical protein A8L45_19665 [Veronia pacifica]